MILYPKAIYRPVPSHGGPMLAHLGLIEHVQVGSNSCYPEFSNVKNQASATWWISKTGVVEQYVDADLMAWAEAQGNGTYDSFETEGLPTEPLTGAQIEAAAELYAWGYHIYGWPLQLADQPGIKGLGWHGMGAAAWGNHPNCPGDLRKAQRAAIIARAGQIIQPSTAPGAVPTVTTIDLGDEDVALHEIQYNNIQLGDHGEGWVFCDAPADKIRDFVQQGSFPPVDGYWNLVIFGRQARATDGHQSVITIQGGSSKQIISFNVLYSD